MTSPIRSALSSDKPRFVGSQVKLEKLCSKGKSSLRQKDLLNDGPYPVYGASGVIGTMSTYQNDAPCVCVVKDGAGVGHAMKCRARSSVLGTMQALVPSEGINCDYLLHLVRSLKLGEGFTGSTIPHIYFRDYGKRLVPVFPYEQQIAIASMLNGIEALVDQRELMLRKCDSLVKSRFVEMFGSRDVGYKYPSKPLGELATFKSGASLPKDREQSSGDVIYAKVGDLNLTENSLAIVTSRVFVDAKTAGKHIIPEGAVVFPKRGGAIATNKKRITVQECCLDLNLMSVIPGKKLGTRYLLAWFDSFDLADIANGSAVPQINNKDLNPLQIPLPPLSLQQEFATCVAQVDKLRFAIQEQIKKLETLKASLMQEYFG